MPDDPTQRGGQDDEKKRDPQHRTTTHAPELNAGVVPADRLRMREAIKSVADHEAAERVHEIVEKGERKTPDAPATGERK
jgi:hypothetical protein